MFHFMNIVQQNGVFDFLMWAFHEIAEIFGVSVLQILQKFNKLQVWGFYKYSKYSINFGCERLVWVWAFY